MTALHLVSGFRFLRDGSVILVLLILCGVPVVSEQSKPEHAVEHGTLRVAGIVVSAKTGAPLAQARVFLTANRNRRETASVLTQEDGRFEFKGLSAGKYSLQGARRGYLSASYDQHEQYSTAIVTGAGYDTENLRLRLVPMAVLSGSVLDENGEPVRGAQIRVFGESHRGGTTRVLLISNTATDDEGTFEVAGLTPGKYFAAASAAPWYAMHVPSSGNTSSGVDPSLDVAYPRTFYGGATESEGAEPMQIAAGDRTRIEIHLSPVPAIHLVFHVPDLTRGYQLPALEQRTFDSEEGVAITGTAASSSPNAIEITGLAPGHYTVRAPIGSSGQFQQRGEVDLRQDGEDLNEVLSEQLGSVKMSVKLPADAAVPKQMGLGLQNEKNTTISYSPIDAQGQANFAGVPAGQYSVRVFTQTTAYSITQMTSKERQISGSQFILKPGDTQEWTVSLSAGRTTIEGFVKRNAEAAPGVMVVLIPKDPEAHEDLFRRDQSDLDGSFALRGVVPGLYTVVAIEDAWSFDWSKPLLLARYAQHGQAVTVSELMQGAVSLADAVQVQPR